MNEWMDVSINDQRKLGKKAKIDVLVLDIGPA